MQIVSVLVVFTTQKVFGTRESERVSRRDKGRALEILAFYGNFFPTLREIKDENRKWEG